MKVNLNPYSIAFGTKAHYGWSKASTRSEFGANSRDLRELKNSPHPSSSLRETNGTQAEHVSDVVLLFNSPKEIADYVKELSRRVQEYSQTSGYVYNYEIDTARSIVDDTVSHLECKIDFERLGINPDKLSTDEAIEYGAQFAFWTTNLNGSPRNGLVRPGFVRSAKEYVKLVEDSYPLDAAGEFEDIIERLSGAEVAADRKIQDGYDLQYKTARSDYQKLPFSKKFSTPEPKPKYSSIHGELKRLKELRDRTMKNYNNARKAVAKKIWVDDTFSNTN